MEYRVKQKSNETTGEALDGQKKKNKKKKTKVEDE